MRKFSSYGPVNTKLHYYVPRQELVDRACTQLLGENPDEGGHYITVWAPRQRGKTWVMRETFLAMRQERPEFEIVVLSLQHLRTVQDADKVIQIIAQELIKKLSLEHVQVQTVNEFERLFRREILAKPLILILDEFDALPESAISGIAGVFRNVYNSRQYQSDRVSAEKDYVLHGVALIGVRSVLGIENVTGSPFNVQRSVHIPNLTFEEVEAMFRWYERESGQTVEQAVIDQLFYETRGQPGLTSWFGELLAETYNKHNPTITARDFEIVFAAATNVLPNNNILNILSKAKQEPHRSFVLELFETDTRVPFRYDDERTNFLYLNGAIDRKVEDEDKYYIRFACPFVQKRLFNYFAGAVFREIGQLYAPFEDLSDTITDDGLNVKNLLRRYESYLQKNRGWLLKDAPRRADLRVREAVYHFNLYLYLDKFLRHWSGRVWPEFPTGNGKLDLLIRHAGQIYGLEVKSFVNAYEHRKALHQAARYGHQLGSSEITLAFFVEIVDDANRARYEVVYGDAETGVTVTPVFVATGT